MIHNESPISEFVILYFVINFRLISVVWCVKMRFLKHLKFSMKIESNVSFEFTFKSTSSQMTRSTLASIPLGVGWFFNGTSTQKGQFVPTVGEGNRFSQLRMANKVGKMEQLVYSCVTTTKNCWVKACGHEMFT